MSTEIRRQAAEEDAEFKAALERILGRLSRVNLKLEETRTNLDKLKRSLNN